MIAETINGSLAADLPCCGVFAVAKACNVSVETAFNWLRDHLRKPKNWKGRTYLSERIALLNRFAPHYHAAAIPRRVTLKAWAKRYAKWNQTYVVDVRGHSMHYCNGVITDQYGVKAVGEHGKARSFVRGAFCVLVRS